MDISNISISYVLFMQIPQSLSKTSDGPDDILDEDMTQNGSTKAAEDEVIGETVRQARTSHQTQSYQTIASKLILHTESSIITSLQVAGSLYIPCLVSPPATLPLTSAQCEYLLRFYFQTQTSRTRQLRLRPPRFSQSSKGTKHERRFRRCDRSFF